jgi:hypothetical protein
MPSAVTLCRDGCDHDDDAAVVVDGSSCRLRMSFVPSAVMLCRDGCDHDGDAAVVVDGSSPCPRLSSVPSAVMLCREGCDDGNVAAVVDGLSRRLGTSLFLSHLRTADIVDVGLSSLTHVYCIARSIS